MYWPIGAPKIYAAHKHTARSKGEDFSHDGLDESANGQAGAHDEQEIVDIRLARGGHLFATITRSSLSIWQTKASRLPLPVAHPMLTDVFVAYHTVGHRLSLRTISTYLWSQYIAAAPPGRSYHRHTN